MALKSTVFKAELQVTDLDRHYYASHALVIARHPSETDERLMVRLLGFALNADDRLTFGVGLSTPDEPDLSLRSLTGELDCWIDVGLPDSRALRKAAGRARRVVVYAYGKNVSTWWGKEQAECARIGNLDVIAFDAAATESLAQLADRNMRVHCLIQEGDVTITVGDEASAVLTPVRLKTVG